MGTTVSDIMLMIVHCMYQLDSAGAHIVGLTLFWVFCEGALLENDI